MFKNIDVEDIKQTVKELKRELVGVEGMGHTFNEPACYSILYKINSDREEVERLRSIVNLLLDELNFKVTEGLRLEDK